MDEQAPHIHTGNQLYTDTTNPFHCYVNTHPALPVPVSVGYSITTPYNQPQCVQGSTFNQAQQFQQCRNCLSKVFPPVEAGSGSFLGRRAQSIPSVSLKPAPVIQSVGFQQNPSFHTATNTVNTPHHTFLTDSASQFNSNTVLTMTLHSSQTISTPIMLSMSRRSRMGCLTCRYRKRRCCETKPHCVECVRLGLTCEWPDPGSENKNRTKSEREKEKYHYDEVFGNVKIHRGVVCSRIRD